MSRMLPMPVPGLHAPEMLVSVQTILGAFSRVPIVVAYVGPDQIMPLASVLGAIVGVAVMFWHKLVGLVRKVLGLFTRRGQSTRSDPPIEDRA
jgi:undecaprenyl pyrophosphate phosphatase UppP